MKRFTLLVAVVFAVGLVLVLAWRLSDIILMFIASLAVAATLRAPIEWLAARRVPRALATALMYLGLIGGGLGLFILLYETLGDELGALSEELSVIYARMGQLLSGFRGEYGSAITARFPTPEQLTQLLTDSNVGDMERAVLGAGQSVARTLTDAVLALILSIYWTADRLRFERLALSFVPAHRRGNVRDTWRALEDGLGRYLRSELLQGLLVGVLLWPVFRLLGLNWPVFWALAAALSWLVPLVGGFIVIVPLWLVVWVQSGALIATAAVAAALVVMAMLEFVLERRLFTRERGMSVLTIAIALIMADAFGLLGLLLAPPLAAMIHILLRELANPTAPRSSQPALAADIAALQSRLATARSLIVAAEDGSHRRLENIADRLERLLGQASRSQGDMMS